MEPQAAVSPKAAGAVPGGLEHPLARYLASFGTVPPPHREPVRILGDDGLPVGPAPEVPAEDLRSMYEWMLRSRAFDNRLTSLQRQGRIGFLVGAVGEEATLIGTAAALRPEDWVFPCYREQAVALFRGYPLEDLLCQMYGNSGDYLKGRQMPNHFGCPRYRFAVASSPVGTQIPQAVGAAWTARIRRESWIAAVYFGDGATSTGDFHAGLNMAAVQQLPVLFLCKNNGWAISLPRAKQTRVEFLADKAAAYGMPGIAVDGNDLLAVYEVTRQAADYARSGSGPVLLEFITQRMGPHSTADDPSRYREEELLEPWRKRDPLPRFRAYLESLGYWNDEDETWTQQQTENRLAEAIGKVEALPPPALETMFQDVYAAMPWHLREQLDGAMEG